MQPEGICPVRFLFSICVVWTDCQCAGNAAAVSANRSAASGLGKVCGRTASVCAGAVKKGAAVSYTHLDVYKRQVYGIFYADEFFCTAE